MKRQLYMAIVAIIICITLSLSAAPAKKTIIHLGEKPGNMPFSSAILVDQTLYISGQLATNPDSGEFVNGTIAEQSERIIQNMELLLKKAGFTLADVVNATVYITDFKEFAEFNEVYRKFFPKDPPTRATVQVSKLARDAKIEISAIAVK